MAHRERGCVACHRGGLERLLVRSTLEEVVCSRREIRVQEALASSIVESRPPNGEQLPVEAIAQKDMRERVPPLLRRRLENPRRAGLREARFHRVLSDLRDRRDVHDVGLSPEHGRCLDQRRRLGREARDVLVEDGAKTVGHVSRVEPGARPKNLANEERVAFGHRVDVTGDVLGRLRRCSSNPRDDFVALEPRQHEHFAFTTNLCEQRSGLGGEASLDFPIPGSPTKQRRPPSPANPRVSIARACSRSLRRP
ncbi:MAG TPA: hypothetical protein VM925_16400, partial [Labilithrix sp.]|nr:hypothetical protein [Labilithrix sp.]